MKKETKKYETKHMHKTEDFISKYNAGCREKKEKKILEEINELYESMDYFSNRPCFYWGSMSHRMYHKDFDQVRELEDKLHELRRK